MDKEHLVRMANRIGDFFVAMPDRNEAIEGIATHIRRFWEPRMRKQILAHVDEGGTDLNEIVLLALQRHGATLR